MRAVLLCLIFALCCMAHGALSQPDLDLTATPSQDVVKPRQTLSLVILVANKSSTPVSNLEVKLLSREFELPTPLTISLVGPFATAVVATNVKVLPAASFATHHLVLVADFKWGVNLSFHSSKSAVLNLQVAHTYEDEAKGLPGGSAALLYLLLPIIPGFLSFDLLNGIRKGESLSLPKFDSSYLAPAFLLTILLEYLIVLARAHNWNFDLSDPQQLMFVLAGSTVAGGLVPLTRIAIQRLRAFKESDDLPTYLKKALQLFPGGQADWVLGTGNTQGLQGLLLKQPDHKLALGARLQVSPAQPTDVALKQCFNDNLDLSNPTLLVQLVAQGRAVLALLQPVQAEGRPWPRPVLAHRMPTLSYEKPESRSIVEYTE